MVKASCDDRGPWQEAAAPRTFRSVEGTLSLPCRVSPSGDQIFIKIFISLTIHAYTSMCMNIIDSFVDPPRIALPCFTNIIN